MISGSFSCHGLRLRSYSFLASDCGSPELPERPEDATAEPGFLTFDTCTGR